MVDRQLAQHQHYAGQLPPSREMRVGVGVLGRWRLLRQLRHRPDASVEVHGGPNSHTHLDTDAYFNCHAYSNTDTNAAAKANAHAKAAAHAVPSSVIGRFRPD